MIKLDIIFELSRIHRQKNKLKNVQLNKKFGGGETILKLRRNDTNIVVIWDGAK